MTSTELSQTTQVDVTQERFAPTMEITGSVVIVTGAARGLGLAFASTLLDRGAKVCLSDINEEVGAAATAELQATHGVNNVTFVKCDVTKDDEFKNLWTTAVEKLGQVTVLINNAGIGNEKNWQLTVDVNMGGCIRGTLLALDKMGTDKGGSGGVVINVSSIAGLKGIPLGPVYSATKHAIVGLTRSLGQEFHHKITGVKVQALCPSFVKTKLLEESIVNAFSPATAAAMPKLAGSLKYMTKEQVAEGLVQLLEEGQNGGCLLVEADSVRYVKSPIES